jgi:tetraacyldisaccharide 4'-kinase
MKAFRKLLLPFSLIYGLVIYLRNFLYDNGKMRSYRFPLPIISIGNLTTGGTGKTPHVEYLIRLLRKDFRIATLSRGYGRKSKGFIIAGSPSNTRLIGDEPMQYLSKFKDIIVSVSENRAEAIEKIVQLEMIPKVIIMDDAYQHRQVIPGLNILLLEYESVFDRDYLLPAGNLREPLTSIKRADIVIITKTPNILVPIEKKRILEKLKTHSGQAIFFSFIRYGEFTKIFGQQNTMQMGAGYYAEKRFTILLVTGIANPSGLIEYLRRMTDKIELLVFPDHHEFTPKDIQRIQQTFDNIANQSKIILTTEKDAMRIRNPDIDTSVQKLPFFYLPIEIHIHQEEEKFNNIILEYVRKNQPDKKVHS